MYQESNENNNLAIIPITLDMPEAIPFSNDIIAGDELSHYQTAGDPSSQPVWSLNNRINGIVKVGSGYTLTISHCTIEFMTPESGIVVEKGGRLIVEHATLRGNECLGNVWKGIEVLGTVDYPHDITEPYTESSPNFGICILDHAIIKDAKIGVATCGTTNDPNNYFTSDGQGLLVSSNESVFENNEIGIYLAPFKQVSKCRITDTHFNNSNLFVGTYDILKKDDGTPLAKPVGICLKASKMENPFLRNTFETTMEGVPTYGIGILDYHSRLSVGDGSVENANSFAKLYSGVEYYAPFSYNSQLDINNNTFQDNFKGITLTGGAFAKIRNNTLNVPNTQLAYGIKTLGSVGILTTFNTLNSTASSGLTTIGIITERTGNSDYHAEIIENTFNGPFTVAQAFSGRNLSITANCNAYYGSFCDWYLFPYAEVQAQGNCDDSDARRNLFHSGTNGYHIYSESSAFLSYTPQPGFSPNPAICQGAVEIEPECEQVNTPCTSFLVGGGCDPDEVKSLLSQTTDGEERIRLYTRLLYDRLCLDEKQEAIADMNEEDRNASYKLLTATHTDDEQSAEAWAALLKIVPENAEDIDFYPTYENVLNGINWPNGGGKTQDSQTARLWQAALNPADPNTALAQAIVGQNTATVFDRNIEVPTFKVLQATDIARCFTLIPNPAQDMAMLSLQTYIPLPALLQIYDPMGREMQTIKVTHLASTTFSVADLPNGIYYCRLAYNNEAYGIQKLVVIR